MGLNISGLINKNISMTLTLNNFFNKKIAVDAFNVIYQFLSVIRDNRGRPLKNMDREITSHLSGLFYRNIKLLENNIRPIYVFDGSIKEHKLRHKLNINRPENYVSINNFIIESGKQLLTLMGIPYVQATGEGEAQCVYMANKDDVWGVASQDYDVLVYGGERLIRNLAIGSSRKKGDTTIKLDIEFIKLGKFLEYYNITKERLVDMSVLIGNDYFAGVKNIGSVTAMRLVQKYDTFYDIKFDDKCLEDGNIILKDKIKIDMNLLYDSYEYYKNLFLTPDVNKEYEIKKLVPDYDELKSFLVYSNGFSVPRVESGIKRLIKINTSQRQSSLSEFFNMGS